MFENILGQPAAGQLSRDLAAAALAPSMLFQGPPASGKGAAALELARILSCEDPAAPWNCACPACSRHRLLIHPDLLMLGSRPFSAEIAAAAAAFSREPGNAPGRLLFIRSVRKLLARFSPALWEEGLKKIRDLSPLISALEEALEELDAVPASGADSVGGILKNAFKLESEGMGETVPIDQIRRAAYWSRLAPTGKRKFLLIENADRMQEGARNSLLKILEEPPDTVSIVLVSSRPGALLPTILSRLRPYRFVRRDLPAEAAVIRRVFRDPAYAAALEGRAAGMAAGRAAGRAAGSPPGGHISAYLDSFLPVSGDKLRALAAFFAASLARAALIARRRRGLPSQAEELILLGKHCAPLAEAAGLGRPREDIAGMAAGVLKGAENFEVRSLFPQFLSRLLGLVSESLRGAAAGSLAPSRYRDMWREAAAEAEQAALTWNQNPALALERLGTELCRSLAEAALSREASPVSPAGGEAP